MSRVLIALGAFSGCLAVVMAAMAAHALHDPAAIQILRSGVQMQGWHAIMLVVTGLLATHLHTPLAHRIALATGGAFALGSLLFCGDVYLLALRGISLSPLAPVGGMLLMLGWLGLAAAALIRR